MSRKRAFLADIIAHPDDDALRLVYADWLDDQGEEARGEFIRVQCELASPQPWQPPAACDELCRRGQTFAAYEAFGEAVKATQEQRQCLHIRCRELLSNHGHDWMVEAGVCNAVWENVVLSGSENGAMIVPQGWYNHRFTFKRGFLEIVLADFYFFLRFGPELLARSPIRSLRVLPSRGLYSSLRCHTQVDGSSFFYWPAGLLQEAVHKQLELLITQSPPPDIESLHERRYSLEEAVACDVESRQLSSQSDAWQCLGEALTEWASVQAKREGLLPR